MARKNPEDLEWILGAIRRLANPEGSRINEIVACASSKVEPELVQKYLDTQKACGVVRRSISGRWSLVGEVIAPRLAAPARKKQQTTPAGVTPKPTAAELPAVADTGSPLVDESQLAVENAPCEARLVVEAGPGFGKTAVACRRVATLLEATPDAKVLLLSFTRTAVREIRARIDQLAADNTAAKGVEVRTLDSFAGRVRSGLSTDAKFTGGFSANISGAAELLQTPADETKEYLESFDHVIVDEAQDLVGERAQMVIALLRSLRSTTGWTVFLDPAQAIYDWSEDEDGPTESAPFDVEIKRLEPTRCALGHLHRTQQKDLRQLVLAARDVVIKAKPESFTTLRSALEARAGGEQLRFDDAAALIEAHPMRDKLLVLVRRRTEAYDLSERLTRRGVRHQLRFGGLPAAPATWIATVVNAAFVESQDTSIRRDVVEEAWVTVSERHPRITAGWEFDQAWRVLRALGGERGMKKLIDARAIAARLATGPLPDEINRRELGHSGPIISTVHGSKGREADHVLFLLTHVTEPTIDEARVLYVGLSRARQELQLRTLGSFRCQHLPSARPWSKWSSDASSGARVEVGRAGDIDARLSASVIASSIDEHQQRMIAFSGDAQKARAFPQQLDSKWIHHVALDADGEPRIAALSGSCVEDASAVARSALKQPLRRIENLRWIDVASAGIAADGGDTPFTSEPCRSTGLFLLPVVVGPGTLFKKKDA